MFFRKTLFKPQTSLAIATMLTACSGSLDGGSLTGSFTGISNVRVLGPETIEISWQIRSSCTQYRIFDLTKDTQSPVEVATIPPVKLTAPKIKDATHYTFSVGCADSSGNVSGLGINLSADSLPKFTGELTGTLDGSSDLDRMPKLAWKYPQGTMTTFEIYYKEAVYPGDQSAWALQGSPANGYLGNLLCQTMANQVKIGPGQDCDTDTLESGHVYDFKVVARYPDGSHSLDLASPTTAVQLPIPSKFTDPPCTLTTLGIGSSKTNSHLILRCNSSAPTATCHHIRAQAFQFDPVTHTEVSISELLDGDGSVAIQPAAPAGINDREIQNLEIKFWCEDTTTHKWNQLVRYYDGVNGHEATPRLKYATERYEAAPPKASKDNPSFLGRSTAIGDFDCDGQPDLAIGLPDLSINEDGYANTAPQSGAVRVLYNYKMNGTNLSYAYSKYISFNDLPNYTRFGSALSAGNINRDYRMVLHNNKTQYYSCDDLIVGAPGGTSIGTGFATVFFGHEGGLVATDRYLSSIAVNTPSCSGSVCNPVKLVGDNSQDEANLKVYPLTHGGQYVPNINWDPTDNFASAVAYAGDFNADGYGDVAIGYPGCNWDGWAINNEDLSTSTPGVYRSATPPPQQVGCVYMFWGGKNGITPVNMGRNPFYAKSGATPSSNAGYLISPYAKIYPPFGQSNMRFGASLSGGGDVDGRRPVPVVPEGSSPSTFSGDSAYPVILASGSDLVIGAPGFSYKDTTKLSQGGEVDISSSWSVSGLNVDPLVVRTQGTDLKWIAFNGGNINSTNIRNPIITPPLNLGWHTTANPVFDDSSAMKAGAGSTSTGIAFLMLGRHAMKSYQLKSSLNNTLFTTDTSGLGTLADLTDVFKNFSKDLLSRGNGGRQIYALTNTLNDPLVSPRESFYNCGSRGNPYNDSSGNGSGEFRHVSCLAGRNNFSVIHPEVGPGAAPTTGFGSKVAIMGAPEENSMALFEIENEETITDASGLFADPSDPTGNSFIYRSNQPVRIHDRIRGSRQWGRGMPGVNVDDTAITGTSFDFIPARESIKEVPNLASSLPVTSIGQKAIGTDLNQDGYADVVVGSNNSIYTFFGNYASDFSAASAYLSSSNPTLSSGTTTRNAALNEFPGASASEFLTPTTNRVCTTLKKSLVISQAGSAAGAEVKASIVSTYPFYASNSVFSRYVGDASTTYSASMSYATPNRPASPLNGCIPQRIGTSGVPSSFSVASVSTQEDGIPDLVAGFGSGSSNLVTQYLHSSNLKGFWGSSAPPISATAGSFGASVTATGWTYNYDPASNSLVCSVRRDVIAGSPLFNNGKGAITLFSASSGLPFSSKAVLSDTTSKPNDLNIEYSRIIGDINGDGSDDILVPVKTFVNGSAVYDSLIYFGSKYGPITYGFCKEHLNDLHKIDGSGISQTDCEGALQPVPVSFAGDTNQYLLPQYLPRLGQGLTTSWSLRVSPAGDVNHDGFDDFIVVDFYNSTNSTYGAQNIHLFFGSQSGVIAHNPPAVGLSAGKEPQWVVKTTMTYNNPFYNYKGIFLTGNTPNFTRVSSWGFEEKGAITGNEPNAAFRDSWMLPQTQFSLTSGDFNGDGFADLALGVPFGRSPSRDAGGTPLPADNLNPDQDVSSGKWACGLQDIGIGACEINALPGVTNTNQPFKRGDTIPNAGYVVVLYGSQFGYQVPDQSFSEASNDLTNENCTDNYQSCSGTPANLKEVYGTLGNPIASSGSAGNYEIGDPASFPCDGTQLSEGEYSCSAGSLIRNPQFKEIWTQASDSHGSLLALSNSYFGASVTAADMNGDGIDDLVVGAPGFTVASQTYTGKDYRAGGAFVYYGMKGYGVVAPTADRMVGDQGRLGNLKDLTPVVVTGYDRDDFVFMLSPTNYSDTSGTILPDLEGTSTQRRNFAIGSSAGDFNGDGFDDLAIASSSGQIYVYYGPVCTAHNAKALWDKGKSLSQAQIPWTFAKVDPTFPNQTCSRPDFNLTGQLPGAGVRTTSLPITPDTVLAPQVITAFGATNMQMTGVALLSKRPNRITGLNPGDVNLGPDHASDLLIGTYKRSDPNMPTSSTGLGILLFGHKAPVAGSGDMETLPGLFVGKQDSSLTADLTSATVAIGPATGTAAAPTVTKSFYAPVMLQPHSRDGAVGNFYRDACSMGDLNGDGSGDFVLGTRYYQFDADGQPVITGGAFKLIY